MQHFISYFLLFCLSFYALEVSGQTCQCESCPVDVPDETLVEIPYVVDGAEFNNLGTNNEICRVNVKFKHSYMGDMTITLKSPTGELIQLTGNVEQSGFTTATIFDVSFVPCTATPMPDPNKSIKWDNNQNWGSFGSYTGSYIPFDPNVCFESFTGSVNGTWTLIAEDHDQFYRGEILNFSIEFCNMSGIDCCTPDAGDWSQNDDIVTCVSQSLDFDIEPLYVTNAPNSEYIYKFVITENGFITGFLDRPDLTAYGVGSYTICGLSIFEGNVDNLPPTDGTVLLSDVIATLSSLSPMFCGDFSTECVDVQILPAIPVTYLYEEICDGDFFTFGGKDYYESGIYSDTLLSGIGCDSILELSLIINSLDSTYIDKTSCFQGDVGLDTVYLKNAAQCDSIVFLNIIYAESDIIELSKQTCFIDSVGMDTVFLKNRFDCDSLVIYTTSLYPISNPTTTTQYSCNVLDQGYDTIIHSNQYGCDSLEIVQTIFIDDDIIELSKKTCFVDSIGIDTVVLKNVFDCDSLIITTTSLFNLSQPTLFFNTSCDELDAGIDTIVIPDHNGCDSLIITTTIYTPPSDTVFISRITCDENEIGVVTEILEDHNSCDSIIVTSTIKLPVDTILLDSFSCEFTNIFIDTIYFKNQFGCDSVIWIRSFNPLESSSFELFTGSCDPNDVGTFYDTLTNAVGCDSFLTTHIELYDVDINLIFKTVCEPHFPMIDTAMYNGVLCDSVVITHYQYEPPISNQIDKTSCDPNLVGIHIDTLLNNGGCDSVYLTTTTILVGADTTYTDYETCDPTAEPIIVVFEREDCDSINISMPILIYGDSLYVDSLVCEFVGENPIIDTFRNNQGCLNWIFTNLILQPVDTTFVKDSTCNPNKEGTIIISYDIGEDCDSVVSKTTILMPSYLMPVEKLTCNPLDTGMIYDTLNTNYGCDSILMIHTSLTEQIVVIDSFTSCNLLQVGRDTIFLPGEICDTLKITDISYLPLDTILYQKDTCLWSVVKDTFIHNINFQGCDSITHLVIDYAPLDTTFIYTFNCSESDTITENFLRNNCDSTVVTYSAYKAPSETFIYDSTCIVKDTGSVFILEFDDYGCDSFVYFITMLIEPDTTFIFKESCNPRDTGVVDTTIIENGCPEIIKTTTSYIDAWSYELEIQNVSCHNQNDGFISITVPDDVTIDWGNGNSQAIRDNLSEGQYPVTISGANCTIEDVFIIENPPSITNEFKKVEGNCQKNGGVLQSIPSGGTPYDSNPRYLFEWNNGKISDVIDNLSSGQYFVTITDQFDCILVDSAILDNKELVLSLEKQNISCNGYTDGWLKLKIEEGLPPYQINWSTGDTSFQIENLSVGLYEAGVEDANGCLATISYAIKEPAPLSVTFSKTFSQGVGQINAFVLGGTNPYDYLWSNDETSFSIKDLSEGTYSVTITDFNGCIFEAETELTTETSVLDLQSQFSIYPNPTNDIFFIDFGKKIDKKISIFSSSGNLVYQTQNSDIITQINCREASFPNGVYFVIIKTELNTFISKVILLNH